MVAKTIYHLQTPVNIFSTKSSLTENTQQALYKFSHRSIYNAENERGTKHMIYYIK
jgi:hypothetical protein